MRSKADLVELEDELIQKALSFTRPFTTSEVGDGTDYHLACTVLRRLQQQGELRIVNSDLPIRYEWVNE